MNDSVSILRLQDAWRESQRHAYHLRRASNQLGPILPMTGNRFVHLTDEQIQTLDQYILRFTKLQDAIGSRLYPAILDCLQATCEGRQIILDSSVERARVGCWRRVWVGATTTKAPAFEEEQHPQTRRQ